MSTATRLTGFALGLAVLFGAAYAVGSLTGAPAAPAPAGGHGHADAATGGHSHGAGAGPAGAEHPVGGLAIAEYGYRLHRLSPDPAPGRPAELAFQVLGPSGRPVTAFVNTHDKPLHLIVARRDLSGFQHLHPALDATGTWRVPLTLPAAGEYRVFADFVPDTRTDTVVLGMDLPVAGQFAPAPLPAPATEARVDGYTVRMLDAPAPGSARPVRFVISRGGTPVTDLEPYLAAYGHLVVLRQGDLGYLHSHPEGGPGTSPPGPEVAFGAELPSAGTYRLYLDFAHGGAVHTAEFTVVAGEAP
jgi:hypothetical protein